MKLDRTSTLPSYIQLANHLREQIHTGTFGAGSQLPTEAELVVRSKLSRITVRRGLEILEREGLVVKRQGLGTFVRNPIRQELSSVRTMTEVLLEKGITPRIKVLNFGETIPPEEVRISMRLEPEERLLLVERLYFDEDEPIALVRIYLPLSIRAEADPLRRADTPVETTYRIWEKKVGIRLKSARYAIRAARAEEHEAEALALAIGDPVLIVDRVTFGEDGRPLEHLVFHHRPERYEFTISVPRVASLP